MPGTWCLVCSTYVRRMEPLRNYETHLCLGGGRPQVNQGDNPPLLFCVAVSFGWSVADTRAPGRRWARGDGRGRGERCPRACHRQCGHRCWSGDAGEFFLFPRLWYVFRVRLRLKLRLAAVYDGHSGPLLLLVLVARLVSCGGCCVRPGWIDVFFAVVVGRGDPRACCVRLFGVSVVLVLVIFCLFHVCVLC